MAARKIFFVGPILCAAMTCLAPTVAAGATAANDLRAKNLTVAVEIDGSLPGFTQDQLFAFVTQQMGAADVTAWRFTAAPSGSADQINRVVWHFKPMPFAGGAVRYIGPALNRAREAFGVGRVIGIDAKIYLDGKYQASTFDQVTIKGGANDPALTGEIKKVTRAIVADALAENLRGTAKSAG